MVGAMMMTQRGFLQQPLPVPNHTGNANVDNRIPAPVLAKFDLPDRSSQCRMGDILLDLVDTKLFDDTPLFDVAMSIQNKEVPLDECVVIFERFAKYVRDGDVAMVKRYARGLA
jgi:hypothetical protein